MGADGFKRNRRQRPSGSDTVAIRGGEACSEVRSPGDGAIDSRWQAGRRPAMVSTET